LPFEIPYPTAEGEETALVYVLIERQSDTDPFMPLRMLYFTVVYWDRQWREWEALERPRPAFRLRPVLPLVLFTGAAPWGSNRTLADLLGEPAAFRPFAPVWQPLFWNLATQTAEELLRSDARWLEVLAMLRVQAEEAPRFLTVTLEAVRRLDLLQEADRIRLSGLLRLLFLFIQRRPAAERDQILAEVAAAAARHRPEVEAMAKTIAESWLEEGLAKGDLRTARTFVRTLLEDRFGALPQAFLQQLDAVTDHRRLLQAARQVSSLEKLEDLQL
jgi:hypothetical protein